MLRGGISAIAQSRPPRLLAHGTHFFRPPRLLQPFCANPNHLRRNTYRNFLRCYSSNIQANGRMYASDRLLRYAATPQPRVDLYLIHN